MAGIDLEAIKKRLAQLNGSAKKDGGAGNIWWKPDVGEYKVRVVPFTDNGGQPFKEIWYYNGIGVPNERGHGPFPMPTLKQFNTPDPVQELINDLRKDESEKEKNKPMLKKLYPKLTIMIPVIVRGEEDKGVRIWPVKNPKLYEQLLGYFVDSDVLEETADWTDVNTGCDLKVKVFTAGKVWNGNPVKETTVEMRIKSMPLSNDPAQITKWVAAIPDVTKVDPVPTYEEAKRRLEQWLNAGAGEKSGEDTSRGTDTGGSDLDKLAEDVKDTKPAAKSEETKAEAKAPEQKPAEKPAEKPKAKKKIENTEKDLQEMFDELESGSK